jgi:hypothetical protein
VESTRTRRPGRLATLDDIGQDPGEARAKIEAARDFLEAAFGRQEAPDERLAALVARLDRMAAEVERVEDAVTTHLPVGEAMAPPKSRTRSVPPADPTRCRPSKVRPD